MPDEHGMPAVDGYEEFWMDFAVEPLDVFLVAVSGGMDEVLAGGAIADDFYPLSGQPILHFLHL